MVVMRSMTGDFMLLLLCVKGDESLHQPGWLLLSPHSITVVTVAVSPLIFELFSSLTYRCSAASPMAELEPVLSKSYYSMVACSIQCIYPAINTPPNNVALHCKEKGDTTTGCLDMKDPFLKQHSRVYSTYKTKLLMRLHKQQEKLSH